MAKEKTREIIIKESKGRFNIFRSSNVEKESYDFSSLLALRQLLSNEKARILNVIKHENPKSIYDLAKKLNRGFKSVNDDLKLLERFGFIDIVQEKTKNRTRHRPKIVVDKIIIQMNV